MSDCTSLKNLGPTAKACFVKAQLKTRHHWPCRPLVCLSPFSCSCFMAEGPTQWVCHCRHHRTPYHSLSPVEDSGEIMRNQCSKVPTSMQTVNASRIIKICIQDMYANLCVCVCPVRVHKYIDYFNDAQVCMKTVYIRTQPAACLLDLLACFAKESHRETELSSCKGVPHLSSKQWTWVIKCPHFSHHPTIRFH